VNVLLVCSPGGHLQQMLELKPAWTETQRAWVTLPGADVKVLLSDEAVTLGHGPTNRSVRNMLRNGGLAWRVLRRRRPDAILSTGAGLAVPFFVVGRLLGITCVYVESVTRTESLSLSGRMVYPLANRFFVQWPELAAKHRKATYAGAVL
jgi:beta-1,4-N-acetylglucosaminyltransferase